jgi:SAM-dependent methyltransferase
VSILSDLTREELFRIAAEVGQRQGWDFSTVCDARDPVPWDYEDVVRRHLQPGDRVLDCGTGGGERFLALRDAYAWGMGIDPDPAMLATARAHAASLQATHVTFALGRAEALPVDDASVDVVLNRHANVDVAETLRVLRPGGLFLTQQVGLNNLSAICTIMGCGPGGAYAYDPQETIYRLADAFRAQGGTVLAIAEYDVPYLLLDVASLLFLLQGVGIPEDFDLDTHWRQVLEIVRRCGTPCDTAPPCIRSNEHRELLIVRKG